MNRIHLRLFTPTDDAVLETEDSLPIPAIESPATTSKFRSL